MNQSSEAHKDIIETDIADADTVFGETRIFGEEGEGQGFGIGVKAKPIGKQLTARYWILIQSH